MGLSAAQMQDAHAMLTGMARKRVQDDRERLAELMEARRIELRLQWKDVAQRAQTTRETIRKVRSGAGPHRGLTLTLIDEALEWEPGSIRAVLDGGDPTPKDRGYTPGPAERFEEPPRRVQSPATPGPYSVIEAVEADPNLRHDAKVHLIKQYKLLIELRRETDAVADSVFDEELEMRIAARAAAIRAERALSARQKAQAIEWMEHAERLNPSPARRRDPHDLLFEESPDRDVPLSDVEAAEAMAAVERSEDGRQVDRRQADR